MKDFVVWKILFIFADKIEKTEDMIQTHLMKLEAPYPVLNIEGTLVRHVATLIEVRDAFDDATGEECIKTVSHPVVDYGDNEYAGVVFDKIDLQDCEPLHNPMSTSEFQLLTFKLQRTWGRQMTFWRPEYLVGRLNYLGITIDWPKKKDADGFDTDEPEDLFDLPISIGQSDKVGWWMETSTFFFDFNGNGFKSEAELLSFIRNLRSSYYKAFADHQFDIVFHSNMPEAQRIVAELNANPHL